VIKLHDLGPPGVHSMKVHDEWYDEWFEAHGEGLDRRRGQNDAPVKLYLVSEEGFYEWSKTTRHLAHFHDSQAAFVAAVANQGHPYSFVVEKIMIVKKRKWVSSETEVVGEAFSR
jgi:hypothetical protein